MTRAYFVTVALFVLAFSFAFASDPSPLQDFCVALKNSSDSAVFVNGKICKDPKLAKADDFYFGGLNIAGNTENIFGANFTPVTVDQIPGLNTLGISVARVDYAPNGQTPPHTHPRATERKTNAIAIAALSSQNPGLITIANTVFGSNPPINPDVLIKAFQLDRNVVEHLQKLF
uniref:Cupin type-1 domain-containing protein n=1 Tax=Fagus sylvatica TaxID=28930 RepID=A0A2N9H7E4_FAGSY